MKTGKQVSRRRIGRIMKQQGLVSNYTTAQFKPHKDTCNESKTENVVNRQFQGRESRKSRVCQEKCVSFIKFSYRQFSKLPVLHGRINTVHI